MNRALVTGGCGFIGTNLADRLLREGREVVVLDNLSRPGVRSNLAWLQAEHGSGLRVVEADIREPSAVRRALDAVDSVFHFAAQVAVTTSLSDPQLDFATNVEGTLNLLEQIRCSETAPSLLFTSTNKVYGNLDGLDLELADGRYQPVDPEARRQGVSERQPLHFCSPYGCSKGAADQYVLDYAKTFGLRAVVFRMSCIYGPHQHGNEDQGWVAHLLRQLLTNRPITVYGDGRQVRDLLYVEDLLDALCGAAARADRVAGQAFNVGGGPKNAVSLLEFLTREAERRHRELWLDFAPWRAGDQRWYVSDTRRLQEATGWAPRTEVDDGVDRLGEWLTRSAISSLAGAEG